MCRFKCISIHIYTHTAPRHWPPDQRWIHGGPRARCAAGAAACHAGRAPKIPRVYWINPWLLAIFSGWLMIFSGWLMIFSGWLMIFSGWLMIFSGWLMIFSGWLMIFSGWLMIFSGWLMIFSGWLMIFSGWLMIFSGWLMIFSGWFMDYLWDNGIFGVVISDM